MSRDNIRSERTDLRNDEWRSTGAEYGAMIGRGLTKEQAVSLLAAKGGVTRGTVYRRLRALGALPAYKPRPSYAPRVFATDLTEDEIIARRVDRTPCFLCGTRADVGCRHTRQSPLTTNRTRLIRLSDER